MRIISKFKDYYDAAQGAGMDADRVWKRETVNLPEKVMLKGMRGRDEGSEPWLSMARAAVEGAPRALCVWRQKDAGQAYTEVSGVVAVVGGATFQGMRRRVSRRVFDGSKNGAFDWQVSEESFVWKLDDALKMALAMGAKLDAKADYDTRETLKKKMTAFFGKRFDFANVALEAREPVVVCTGHSGGGANFVANPRLADMGFQRVMDPWSALQEVSMFVGGILSEGERASVSITDKDRLAQRGFDKESFRRAPTKKR